MALLNTGGIRWDPNLMGWPAAGRPPGGEGSKYDARGYLAKKSGGGALSKADREKRTLNVLDCEAVYALFERDALIYVGEGKLGDRLKQHWKGDELVGRWSSYTWVSPWVYTIDGRNGKAKFEAPAKNRHDITTKDFIELLELVAIRLGSPANNRQLPERKDIVWLNQVRSPSSIPPLEEKVDQIQAALAAMSKLLK